MNMYKRLLILVVVQATALPSIALAQTTTIVNPASPSSNAVSQLPENVDPRHANSLLEPRYPRYQVRSGDIFDLIVENVPEFNQALTVQPDGFIALRELGYIHVQGLTSQQIADLLRSKYATILHNPVLTVSLKTFENPYFIAGGEVKKPGKYEMRGDTTLVEAVELAGGFTEAAKHSHVLLFRRASDGQLDVKELDVKSMLRNASLNEDPHLLPGDMIYVPQNTLSKLKGFVMPRATIGPTIHQTP